MDQQRVFPAEDDKNIDRRAIRRRASLSQRFQEFLLENETFRRLHSLQVKVRSTILNCSHSSLTAEQGWNSPRGDAHFRDRQSKAVSVNDAAKQRLFSMMQTIAEEMDAETSAFTFTDKQPKVLDLCMAPGGFLAYCLHRFPAGLADAITLPEEQGGHQVLLSLGDHNPQINIILADVTMYAAELGDQRVPKDHPEEQKLLAPWPHPKRSYDLVICDGQALRTQNVPEYRQRCEQSRLFNSQLVIALQKVRVGGTIIALLHKSHKWRTFTLLQLFSTFSDIHVFKPKRFHSEKSSFYLIAKNIRSQSREATDAAESFRRSWMRATFPDLNESPEDRDRAEDESGDEAGDEDVEGMLQDFGNKFVGLMQPVWMAQATALSNARWMRG